MNAKLDEYYLDLVLSSLAEAENNIQRARAFLARANGLGEYDEKQFRLITNAIRRRRDIYVDWMRIVSKP
jgi:hypothetical protein